MLNALNFYGKYIPTKEARQPIIATHPSPSLSTGRGEGLWPSRSSHKIFSYGEAHRSNTECKEPDWMGMLPKSINGFRVISLNLPQSYKIFPSAKAAIKAFWRERSRGVVACWPGMRIAMRRLSVSMVCVTAEASS